MLRIAFYASGGGNIAEAVDAVSMDVVTGDALTAGVVGVIEAGESS